MIKKKTLLCVDYETNTRFMNLNFEYYMNIEYLYCKKGDGTSMIRTVFCSKIRGQGT